MNYNNDFPNYSLSQVDNENETFLVNRGVPPPLKSPRPVVMPIKTSNSAAVSSSSNPKFSRTPSRGTSTRAIYTGTNRATSSNSSGTVCGVQSLVRPNGRVPIINNLSQTRPGFRSPVNQNTSAAESSITGGRRGRGPNSNSQSPVGSPRAAQSASSANSVQKMQELVTKVLSSSTTEDVAQLVSNTGSATASVTENIRNRDRSRSESASGSPRGGGKPPRSPRQDFHHFSERDESMQDFEDKFERNKLLGKYGGVVKRNDYEYTQ